MRTTRRQLLAGFGAASLPGVFDPRALHASTGPAATAGTGAGGDGEYASDPQVIHLNTGTAGCTPRGVLERVAEAALKMERNPPRQAYGAVPGSLLMDAEQERARCARFLGVAPAEVLVTRGTTDAMNTVAQSLLLENGDRILTSDSEHDGGLLCWRWLARRQGLHVDEVAIAPEDTDTDAIVQRFAAAITPRTRVLSISHVIAWTGLVMPIAAISAMARARGVITVVDGAQALGNIPVDVAALGCDAYATTGHKWLLGPKGSGLLVVRTDAQARIQPVAWEDGKRLCSEAMGLCPLPLVIGLGAAVEQLQQRGIDGVLAHNVALRDRLYGELMQVDGLRVVGPPPGPLACGLVAFRLPDGVDAATLRKTLQDKHGIQVRAVDKRVFNGLRVSTHVYNTQGDVDAFLMALRAELGSGNGVRAG
jgi:selenocysteine lyase/cysteine desulfurase